MTPMSMPVIVAETITGVSERSTFGLRCFVSLSVSVESSSMWRRRNLSVPRMMSRSVLFMMLLLLNPRALLGQPTKEKREEGWEFRPL